MVTLTEGIYVIGSVLAETLPETLPQALVPAPTTLPLPVPDVVITLGGFALWNLEKSSGNTFSVTYVGNYGWILKKNQLYMSVTKADTFSITPAGENVWNISVPNQNSYLKVVGIGNKTGEEATGEEEILELEKDNVDVPRVIAGPKKGIPAEQFRFTRIDRK